MLLIQPTEEMSKQIREELNENVATRDKDLEIIKEWLIKQPHLPDFYGDYTSINVPSILLRNCQALDRVRWFFFLPPAILFTLVWSSSRDLHQLRYFSAPDDYRLMTFLRGCKFSLEKCKKKLDMYFTMRTVVPEFFSNRDITRPELREITKIV